MVLDPEGVMVTFMWIKDQLLSNLVDARGINGAKNMKFPRMKASSYVAVALKSGDFSANLQKMFGHQGGVLCLDYLKLDTSTCSCHKIILQLCWQVDPN